MCSVPGVPTPGSEVSVLITRVNLNQNCGLVELWVNMNKEIKHVYEQMREEIQIPKRNFCGLEGKAGDLCLVNINDTWHRARIVSMQNETYSVFLIDQGQPHSTISEALAWGKDECFILPPEIESCVLANVLSIENNWPDRATNFLKSLPGKEFKGLVQHALMPDRTILLELPTISKHLCKEGVAKKIPVSEFKNLVLKCLNLPKENQSCSITKEQSLNVSSQLENDNYFYPELLTNTFETIRVTEAIDPQNIYCELVIFSKALKILSEQMNEDCEHTKYNVEELQTETITPPCAAKGFDGKWRRAILRQQIQSKDASVEVMFVDEGKTDLVQATNIKPLHKKFLRMPVVTYRCSLDGVKDNGNEWTTEQTDYLKSLILNQTLVARFDHHNIPEDTYSVSLFAANAACINYFFLEKGDLNEKGEKLQKEKLPTKLIMNSAVSDLVNPGVFPKNLEQDSFIQSNGYNSPFSPMEIPLCDLLTVGSSIGVKISYIESLQKFWCQTAQSDRKLEVLMKDLQNHYASAYPKPLVESICVARNPDNNLWYRAKIITKMQSPNVEVRLIDYGQTKTIPLQDLRPIDPTFLRLDALAFQCCLFNIPTPTDVNYANEEFKKFIDTSAAENNGLQCVVKAVTSDQDGMLLNMVDIQSQSESASEVLMEKCNKKKLDSYNFSTHNIGVNTTEKVWISCLETVHHFYCQLDRNSNLFKQVMDDIEKLASEHASSDCPVDPNTVCIARYTDDKWYRGQIIETSPDLKVRFVDYGKTLTVNQSDIQSFLSEASVAMTIPVLAIPLGLHNIPEEVPREVNEWFAEKVVGNKFTISVKEIDSDGKLIVELFYGSLSVNEQVRGMLEKANSKLTVANPIEDENKQLCNGLKQSLDLNGDNSKQNVLPKSPKMQNGEEKAITDTPEPSSDSQHGNIIEGASEKKMDEEKYASISIVHEENVELPSTLLTGDNKTKSAQSPPSVSPNKTPNISTYKMPILSINKTEELYASSISSPDYFWCQCSNTGDLDKVTRLVQKEGQAQQDANFPKTLVPGSPCLALFSSDNQWYRAQVISRKRDVFTVVFIDYGNEEDIEIKDIRSLSAGLLEVAPQAFLCCLEGIDESKKDLWDDAFYDDFYNLLVDKPHKIKVLKMGHNLDIKVPQFTVQIDNIALHKLIQKYRSPNVSPKSLHRQNILQKTPIKNSNAKLNLYKKPEILVNKTVEVYASSISGPSYFWCQYSNSRELDNVTKLAQIGGWAEDPVFSETLGTGSSCLALYSSDNQWYRAQVISRSGDNLSVVFVDYGNEADVHIIDVRPLTHSLCDIQPQAFLCCLDKFDETTGSWDDAVYDYFYNCLVDKLLKVSVLQVEHNEDVKVPHYTIQFDFDSEFAMKLKKKFCNQLTQKICKQPNIPKLQTNSPQTVRLNVHQTTQRAPVKVVEVDVKVARYNKPNIVLNKTVGTYASSISGPEYFWCQYEILGDMGKIINIAQIEGRAQQDPNFPKKLISGSPCLALFADDNVWYRSQIINKHKDRFSVLFIDYGNEADVHINDVRPISPTLLEIPPHAFLCCLDGFDESKGSWDDAVYDHFYNLLVDRPVKVTASHIVEYKEMSLPQHLVQIQRGNTPINRAMQKYWKPNSKTDNHQAKSEVKSGQKDAKQDAKMLKKPKLNSNRTEKVYASCIVDPHFFWCQFAHLENLEKITKLAQEAGLSQQPPETLDPGSVCLALFSSDNQWYRALVNKKTGDKLNVVFIDYGNEADINVKDVRLLPQNLLEEAPQAFFCTLHEFDKTKGSWADYDHVCNEFYTTLVDKQLKVKIITEEKNRAYQGLPQYSVQIEHEGMNMNKWFEKYWTGRVADQAPEISSSGRNQGLE